LVAANPCWLAGYRFSLSPRRRTGAGTEQRMFWNGWGVFSRIHAVGAIVPFQHRPAITVESFGEQPRDWLLTAISFRRTCAKPGVP
jgi:hypothetical protein